MTTTEKLLPCPFCKPDEDEEPYVLTQSSFFESNYKICCGNSNCRAETGFFETEVWAIKAWNTRADLTPVSAEDLQKVRDAINGVMPLLDVDCADMPDEDSVGWTGDAEIPVTFGQVRAFNAAISILDRIAKAVG